MSFQFACHTCGQIHVGRPGIVADEPIGMYTIPKEQRAARCELSSDHCVIDGKWFFIRGIMEIKVHGEEEPLRWDVWVSVGKKSFEVWRAYNDQQTGSQIAPFEGWLNTWLKQYPETANLRALVHPRDRGMRPRIELEPGEHPLAVEHEKGITPERLTEIYSWIVHGS